ncbi:MAG: heavy metal translocating P-type ATPase, partial [Vibrio sp.]
MSKRCYHCDEPIPNGASYQVLILEKPRAMCCPGCQAVAQTIIDSGLASYYQYRTNTADKADLVPEQLDKLIHYDDPSIQQEFVQTHAQGKSISLSLEGVTCAACAWLIEKQLRRVDGVTHIQVNVTTSRAALSWDDSKTTLSQLLTQIHQLGYKAAPFEANRQEANYHAQLKQLLYRLGIAGIATMQVMMLAVALYFEVFSDLDDTFKHYLRIVSLIFATPVLLYSAQPFYLNAWRNFKSRTLGMDVPVTIALVFAYVASVYATITGRGDVYFESISMFTFFLLLGRFLEMRARRKAAAASANLLKLVPKMAMTETGLQVPVHQLKVGDRIRVLPGEHIPADGIITQGQSLVDESMLTGESIPVLKSEHDAVFAGTLNGQESLLVEVT